jgi:hypothetical protein
MTVEESTLVVDERWCSENKLVRTDKVADGYYVDVASVPECVEYIQKDDACKNGRGLFTWIKTDERS